MATTTKEITEYYVSFETAKLLKSKKFHIPTRSHYDGRGGFGFLDICEIDWNNYKCFRERRCYSAPTLQMAMRWLRKVHHIHTEICLYKTNKDDIEPKKSRKAPYYTFGVWDTITGDNIDKRLRNDFIGDTYEQAAEAAIKYALKNLI